MKWYSQEIKSQYELINKMVGYAIDLKYPDVYFKLVEESYNELFNPGRDKYKLPMVDVIVCVDFAKNYKVDYKDIGIYIIKLITNAFTMLVTDSDLLSHYSSGTFYINKFHLNTTEYCKGRVPYTV